MSDRHVLKNDKVYWCGKEPQFREWCFTDAEHALLSIDGSIGVCKNCLRLITIKEES